MFIAGLISGLLLGFGIGSISMQCMVRHSDNKKAANSVPHSKQSTQCSNCDLPATRQWCKIPLCDRCYRVSTAYLNR